MNNKKIFYLIVFLIPFISLLMMAPISLFHIQTPVNACVVDPTDEPPPPGEGSDPLPAWCTWPDPGNCGSGRCWDMCSGSCGECGGGGVGPSAQCQNFDTNITSNTNIISGDAGLWEAEDGDNMGTDCHVDRDEDGNCPEGQDYCMNPCRNYGNAGAICYRSAVRGWRDGIVDLKIYDITTDSYSNTIRGSGGTLRLQGQYQDGICPDNPLPPFPERTLSHFSEDLNVNIPLYFPSIANDGLEHHLKVYVQNGEDGATCGYTTYKAPIPIPSPPARPACTYGSELATNPDLTNLSNWSFWNVGNGSYSFTNNGILKLTSSGNGSAGIVQNRSDLANKYVYIKAALKRLPGESTGSPYTAIGVNHPATGWEYNIPGGMVYNPANSDSWEIVGNSTPTLISGDVTSTSYGANIWAANAGDYYVGWVSLCESPRPNPPTGTCINSDYDGTVPQTPVKWTWSGATRLQVWDANNIWYYNGAATSPITITSANSLTGKGIPPGRTVYARVTNDSSTFSTTTALSACSLPAAYPTITVSGSLEQNSGSACYVASGSNTFNNPSITVNPNPSTAVTVSTTTISPSLGQATGYNFTVTIDNQGEVLAGRPEPLPNTRLILNANVNNISGVWASSPSGGSGGTCNLSGTTLEVTTSGTPYSKDISFDYSGNWIKLKNSSFNGVSITGVTIPVVVNQYIPGDSDDDNSKYFIIAPSSVGGTVLNTTVLPNSDPANLHYSYPNNWHVNAGSYSPTTVFNPSVFTDYVRSKKSYTPISTLANITADGIYYYTGSLPLSITADPNFNYVLIVPGNVEINKTVFNLTGANDTPIKSIAILATGTLSFNTTTPTTKAGGIFIASSVDTGTLNTQGLKIKGNLIGFSGNTIQRTWGDTSRPGLFVVFDPKQYLDLLPYLSISKYNWEQLK